MPSLAHKLTKDIVDNTITTIKQNGAQNGDHEALYHLLALQSMLSDVDDMDQRNIKKIIKLYKTHTHYEKDNEKALQQRLQRAQKRNDHIQEIKLSFELSEDKKEEEYVDYPVPETFEERELKARKPYLINHFPFLYLSNKNRVMTLQKHLTRDTTYDSGMRFQNNWNERKEKWVPIKIRDIQTHKE